MCCENIQEQGHLWLLWYNPIHKARNCPDMSNKLNCTRYFDTFSRFNRGSTLDNPSHPLFTTDLLFQIEILWNFHLFSCSLQWRHNERVWVSNFDCLLIRLLKCRSTKTSKLRVTDFVRGIYRWPVNSPHKGPVVRKKFPFDDVVM